MNVSLMSFSKKKNSTATPSSGGSSLSGTLREGCSVIRPIIGFDIGRTSFPNYNYAYIADFGRYYYVQDWEWYGGLWWAYMESDPMASFKTGIGASSCYVLRAASEWDGTIVDAVYPTKNKVRTECVDLQLSWADSFDSGKYVVGILGQGTGDAAVNYYVMSPAEMSAFRTALMSNVNSLVGTTEITSELTKALFNPFQYVVSAMWFPFSNIPASASANIKLGWWDTGVSAGVLSEAYEKDNTIITMNTSLSGMDTEVLPWMLMEPYSEYTLVMPPFGSIKLDSKIVASNIDTETTGYPVSIDLDTVYDYISGNAFLEVSINGILVAYKEAQIGVNTIMAQSTQDFIGGSINVLSGLTNMILSPIIGGVSGIGNSIGSLGQIYNGAKGFVPEVQTSGSQGGIGAVQTRSFTIVSRSQFTDFNVQEFGRPLCKTKTISTMSGYIKTMNADIVLANATDAEQEQVRLFMNGGFFYE